MNFGTQLCQASHVKAAVSVRTFALLNSNRERSRSLRDLRLLLVREALRRARKVREAVSARGLLNFVCDVFTAKGSIFVCFSCGVLM